MNFISAARKTDSDPKPHALNGSGTDGSNDRYFSIVYGASRSGTLDLLPSAWDIGMSDEHDEAIAKEYRSRGGTGRLVEDGTIAREIHLDPPEAVEY